MQDITQTIANLIDHQGVAYISSIDQDGYPNTKAMLPPRKREALEVFYFTTNIASKRVDQYQQNPQSCIYFCDQSFFWRSHVYWYDGSIKRC